MIRIDALRVLQKREGEFLTHAEIARELGRKPSTWLREAVDGLVQDRLVVRKLNKLPNGRPQYIYRAVATNRVPLRKEYEMLVTEQRLLKSYPDWLEQQLELARKEIEELRAIVEDR